MTSTYHHGSLRRALLDRAAAHIASSGVASLSLRTLALDEGVSHTAPRHHFGSREGLLTALAAEGFELLADDLAATREAGGSYADVGVAYVRFALAHPGHFAVMFDVDQLTPDDPALLSAHARAFGEILTGVRGLTDPRARADLAAATVAGWSMMHGLVGLARSGALGQPEVAQALGDTSTVDLAERIAPMLHGASGGTP